MHSHEKPCMYTDFDEGMTQQLGPHIGHDSILAILKCQHKVQTIAANTAPSCVLAQHVPYLLNVGPERTAQYQPDHVTLTCTDSMPAP